MANKKLEDRTFVIPDHIIRTVKPGTMRSDFIIRRKDGLTYYNMKRLKHFYENQTEKDPKTYEHLGDKLKDWVNTTLGTNRDSLYKGKKIKSDIGMLNMFKKSHFKDKSNGKPGIRLPKPQTNARQIFTGKGLYENNEHSFDKDLRYFLDENLINKYSLIIESPLYNDVLDIVSDILYYENKSKKYKK